MIAGAVTADLEAVVPLTVLGTSGQQAADTVVDTGFTGYLTLPPAVIDSLALTWLGREEGVLTDGSVELFDVYRAKVRWDGQPRQVEVDTVDGVPLLGMSLLQRHELRIEVAVVGQVAIVPLP